MPNHFKQQTSANIPAAVPNSTFETVVKGKPGFFGRLRLKYHEDKAKENVQTAAIDVIEREALATVKNAVEAQGQELRAEHARVHAQVVAAIGNELTENAAAGFQTLAEKRMGGSLTNIATRSEWLAEIERIAASGNISAADKEALINTALQLHAETEDRQDRVYEGVAAMTDRAYEAAYATTKQITER